MLHEAFGTYAIGHRFVHGGDFDSAQLLTREVLAGWSGWRPGRRSINRRRWRASPKARKRWPDAAQVGCFDSAFHRTMPEVAQRLPLPAELWDAGIRRYGFHGLSCQHVVDKSAPRRWVVR